VALISPVIRYRIYSGNGLGAMGVANICFLTGLTFWLGNMTALGFSLLYEPGSPDVPRFLYHLVPLSIALGHGGASASKHQSRTEAQTGELSLSPTIPATINVRQTMRTGSVGSL
jgi:hypothetical protein